MRGIQKVDRIQKEAPKMELPEDLTSLKRPALQKLCKKAGLKANGKNADMIVALEELRTGTKGDEKDNVPEDAYPVDPLLAPATTSLPPSEPEITTDLPNSPSPEPKKLPRKKTQKRGKRRRGGSKQRSRSNPSSSENSTPIVSASEHSAVINNNPPIEEYMETEISKCSTSSLIPELNPTSNSDIATTGSEPNPTTSDTASEANVPGDCSLQNETQTPTLNDSRKRKRRETYSVSPQPNKQAKLEEIEQVLSSTESAFAEEPPFSPPSSTDRSSSRKRKRNSTYTKSTPTVSSADSTTVEPPSPLQTVTTPEVVSSVPDSEVIPCREATPPMEDDGPPNKRRRRSTFEVSPAEAVVANVPDTVLTTSEEIEPQSALENEILSLLDKRVEERKADPNYKPPFVSSTLSRIPVKSATISKLDKAHQKQFQKMRSIVDYQKQKEKRAALSRVSSLYARPTMSSSAKKVTSTISKVPPSNKGPTIARPTQRRPLTSGVPKTPGDRTTPFKPTVLNTANASFNFKKTVKTPGKVEPAASKTPGKQSAKSSNKYKPYTGKVTEYKYSMY